MAHKRTAATSSRKPEPATATDLNTIYRLKITLNGFKPAIWRRIETPDCPLDVFHYVVQEAMGWHDCHLWEFQVGEQRFGPDMREFGGGFDDMDVAPARSMRLSDLVAAGVKHMRYTYDFGDSWEHTIAFAKPVAAEPKAKYPRCTEGERACPPEDCGGVWGYADLLAVLADPKHPEREERLEWLGGPIDPERFDLEAANKRLRR